MDADSFRERLHTVCEAEVAEYTARYSADHLASTYTPIEDGPAATRSDLLEQFESLTQILDMLLDVDSIPFRDSWREHLVYDPSIDERIGLLLSDFPTSVTLLVLNSRYVPSTGHIGVSTGTEPPARTAQVLASELCHAYQDAFDSPTWEHQYLREGFEIAASTRAIECLAAEVQDSALRRAAAVQRTKTFIEGVLAHGVRQGGVTEATLTDLGIPDPVVQARLAHPLWRPLGRLFPRYHWDATAFLPEYALVGSVLLVSEVEAVERPYAKAFDGTHPWQAFIGQLTEERQSGVGRCLP